MPSGILLLDKPLGLSSNAVLQRVRTLFLRQKAGHVGSLDPLATGMLPICLGEATKIAGQILAGRKRYRFTVALGAATATGDTEGAVTTTAPVPPLERAALEALLTRFRGPQTQTPPMYSAGQRAGQPPYKLARASASEALFGGSRVADAVVQAASGRTRKAPMRSFVSMAVTSARS